MYEVLFQPMKIGSMSLKNRIAMAPMATVADPTAAFHRWSVTTLLPGPRGEPA